MEQKLLTSFKCNQSGVNYRALFSPSLVLLLHSLHWKSLELHRPLVEQVVVLVAVEDDPVVVALISHQLDVDTVLLKEIRSFKSSRIAELAIVGSGCVEVRLLLGALLEAAEDQNVRACDLERAHIELGFGKFKVEELPAVLAFG